MCGLLAFAVDCAKFAGAARDAYAAFLRSDEIRANCRVSDGAPGIDRFAYFDLNADGVPELLTSSQAYEVYAYRDGQVTRWEWASFNPMDAAVDVLQNGAIFSEKSGTETIYSYTTFDAAGAPTTVDFAVTSAAPARYYFAGAEVTEEEWQAQTRDYFAAAEEKAEIKWEQWEPEA